MEKESENKQNNLEDIMIENGEGQKQLKKILMLVALVIVVFIIVLAGMRMFVADDEKQQETPPVTAPTPAANQEKEPLFEEVPIENSEDADAELEKMINQLRDSEKRQQEIQKMQAQNQTAPTPPKPAQETQEAAVQQEKQVQKQPQQQTQKSQSTQKEHDPYNVVNGWYVQVGSFSKYNPNQGFLKNIVDKGYKYYFYRTQVNKKQVTKVIIGPYQSKEEVAAHKARIRKEINDKAFSFRVNDAD